MGGENGFVLVHRGWRDNDIFLDEPMTEREAWLWLIEEAAWKPKQFFVGSKCIDVKRGEIVASLRFLQKAWGWRSFKRARTFLKKLENGHMIGHRAGTGITIITICNYDKYQASPQSAGTERAHDGAQSGHRAGTKLKKVKEGKEIEVGKEPTSISKTRAKKQATQIPDDWLKEIPLEQLTYAATRETSVPTINAEWEKFTGYAQAHGKTYKSWPAAWRNWINSDFRDKGNGKFPETEAARTRRVLTEMYERAEGDEHQRANGNGTGGEIDSELPQLQLGGGGGVRGGNGQAVDGISCGGGGEGDHRDAADEENHSVDRRGSGGLARAKAPGPSRD